MSEIEQAVAPPSLEDTGKSGPIEERSAIHRLASVALPVRKDTGEKVASGGAVEPRQGAVVGVIAGGRRVGFTSEANRGERERYERLRSRLTPTQRAIILAHLSRIGA